ncbi:MAG: alpha/beta fold hydrolase [Egibacteraceae bacterium]
MPLLFSHGSDSLPQFAAVIVELARLVPTARVHVLSGAGHIPHATHPDDWVAGLLAFHDDIAATRRQEAR